MDYCRCLPVELDPEVQGSITLTRVLDPQAQSLAFVQRKPDVIGDRERRGRIHEGHTHFGYTDSREGVMRIRFDVLENLPLIFAIGPLLLMLGHCGSDGLPLLPFKDKLGTESVQGFRLDPTT